MCRPGLRAATWLVALGPIAACAPKDEAQDTGSAGDTGGEVALEATWSVEEAEAAMLDGMDRGLPEPATVNNWFFRLISREQTENGSCYTITGDATEGWVSEWEGECTSSGGYQFLGGWLYRDEASADDSSSNHDMRLLASYHIIAPDGQTTTGGGEMTMITSTALPDGFSVNVEMGGIYEVPGEEGWLGDGVGTGFSLEASRDADGFVASLDGGLTHDDELTLYFDEVSLSDACGEVPMGTLRIRDPSSLWYYFDFGETCDGCAAVTLQGESVGQSCIGADIYEAIDASLHRILP